MLLGHGHNQEQYQRISVEASVEASSSNELFVKLHDKAIECIETMKFAIHEKDFKKKGESSAHAIDVLSLLDDSLDMSIDSKLIQNLHAVYEHSIGMIAKVSKELDPEPLDGLIELLEKPRDGFKELVNQERQGSSVASESGANDL
ncbi:flagellar export chaperone FliS [Vibrio breoganii]